MSTDAEPHEPVDRDGPTARSTNTDGVPSTSTPSDQGPDMIANVVERESSTGFPEIPTQLERDLVQVFKLLSDETRLRILMYLVQNNELHVSALCEKLGQSQPAVSHHLALLRVAGLIEARRDGKHNFYSVRQDRFHSLIGELFQNIRDPNTDEVRFDDYVLSHAD